MGKVAADGLRDGVLGPPLEDATASADPLRLFWVAEARRVVRIRFFFGFVPPAGCAGGLFRLAAGVGFGFGVGLAVLAAAAPAPTRNPGRTRRLAAG